MSASRKVARSHIDADRYIVESMLAVDGWTDDVACIVWGLRRGDVWRSHSGHGLGPVADWLDAQRRLAGDRVVSRVSTYAAGRCSLPEVED